MTSFGHVRRAPEICAALAAAQCGVVRHKPLPKLLDLPPFPAGTKSRLRHIMLAVSISTDADIQRIMAPGRPLCALPARMMFYWLARNYTGASLALIGQFCGGRHHTTVMHGVRLVDADRERFEPDLSKLIEFYAVQGVLS